MRQRKLIAFFLALSFSLSCCGCTVPLPFPDGTAESSAADVPDERRFDTAELKETVLSYKENWNDTDRNMQEQIDYVLNAVDEAYAVYCREEIASYADWDNDALYALSNQCLEDYYVAEEIAAWYFANGSRHSADRALFEDYIDEDHLPYYLANSLNRIIAYARSDAALQSERVHDYYDLVDDTDFDTDKTNKLCAEIYLDLLKEMDVSQSLFDYYSRDYSAEDISAVYQEIREQLVPVRQSIENMLLDSGGLLSAETLEKDPYALLEQYAKRLSPDIAASADKLFSEQLYTKAEGETCYDGSFTMNLPNEQLALMYTYFDGSFFDFLTVTHEFGHFHADWRDTTPVFLQKTNLDIAEVQSQSMVTLFLPFYDEIFGDEAEQRKLIVLLDLLDALISGYAVGEFEHQVMQQLETITPSETAALFDRIMDECCIELELYQVSHLFEQPGYYISYGVSALPAVEMYALVNEDSQQAIAVYDKLSSYSCLSGENTFRDVMKSCGLTDYFVSGSIDALAEKLTQFTEQPEQISEYDETGHSAA